SLTGFLFPIHGFTPALGVGIVACVVLAVALFALYKESLIGAWRWTYVITAVVSLYLNVFVLVVQSFVKVSALNALAPTQTEPPFAVTQAAVLAIFILITLIAAIKSRPLKHRCNSLRCPMFAHNPTSRSYDAGLHHSSLHATARDQTRSDRGRRRANQ